MAGYPYVEQVQDPAAKKALRDAFDKITTLQARVAALEEASLQTGSPVNAGGQRLTNVADPKALQDAVTVAFLRAYVSAQLEGFKGAQGVDGTIDTTGTFTVVVKDGIIVSIT